MSDTNLAVGSQIHLGHSMITFIEPHRGEGLHEYNRWYEHDHAYAAMLAAPGCFGYRRYVAPRRLKDLRFPADGTVADPVDNGSFIALYWMEEGRDTDTFGYSFSVGPDLFASGRMNPNRDHVSTAAYDLAGSVGRGPAPVPPEIALDHPYAGLVVAWIRGDSTESVLAAASALRAERDPELLAEGSPIGQIIDFVQVTKEGGLPPLTGECPEVIRLYFCDQDPEHCWDAFVTLADDVAAQGARLELAAPFIPTIPGTTQYLDELW